MARLALIYDVLRNAHREDILQSRRRRQNLRNFANPLDLTEEEFKSIYRLNHDVFHGLCTELQPFLKDQCRIGEMSVTNKLVSCHCYWVTGQINQRYVGHGEHMSQQTVSRIIEEVTNALNERNILQKYISFPRSYEERNIVKQGFYENFGIPGVLGCVDGCHVSIIKPTYYEERYFNRKGYHSLNVQMICDSKLRILNVDASYPGRTHDSRIWNEHPIKQHLEQLNNQGERVYLLGDSAYPQRVFMMTPILNTQPGTVEDYYDQKQKTARNTIERTFGVLKARWRCLLAARQLHYTPIKSAKLVNACVILHNMCNMHNLDHEELPRHERDAEAYFQNDVVAAAGPASGRELREGRAAHLELAHRLFTARI